MRGKQLTQDFIENDIGLSQRVVIPKPDYAKTFRFKTSRSLGIARDLLDVLPAIQLNNQHFFEADEVNNVRRNRVLSPKLETAEVAVFQMQPEARLRVG